jgi:hypothetical protein
MVTISTTPISQNTISFYFQSKTNMTFWEHQIQTLIEHDEDEQTND